MSRRVRLRSAAGRAHDVELETGQDGRLQACIDGRPISVWVEEAGPAVAGGAAAGSLSLRLTFAERACVVDVQAAAQHVAVHYAGHCFELEVVDARRAAALTAVGGTHGSAPITSPMPGKVVSLLVEVGEQVAAGQGLVVIEAMKMENELRAPRAGIVADLRVQPGQSVHSGELLCCVRAG